MVERSHSRKRVHLNRNELLKSLGAIGSVILASSFLTEKWVQPKIVSGVLPVHAQSSLPRFSMTCWLAVFRENGEVVKDKILPHSLLWARPFYQITPTWADIPLLVTFIHVENGITLSHHSANLITPADGIAYSGDYYFSTGASGSVHLGGTINLPSHPAACSRTYIYL